MTALVLTQANSQVCFLRLYNGSNRISLDDLLSHFGVPHLQDGQQSSGQKRPKAPEKKKEAL
jgi:hypothetical protein